MPDIRAAIILQLATLVTMSVVSSAPARSASPGIDVLLGNTIDLTIELKIGDRRDELRQRFYFTKDGTHILSPAPKGMLEEYEGITYGLNEKLCVEHQRVGYDFHFVACGSFSVTRNLVTLHFDSKDWANEQARTGSAKIETVIAVDGPGKCRFISEERFLTNDIGTNRLYSTTGTCRVMRGRHMTLDEE